MRASGLRRALAAAPWAALDAVATAAYGVLFLIVVGRLVGPAELGLASSALAFALLVEAVSGAGVQEAVVRLPSVDTRRTDAAHALAMALSILAMPAVCLAAWAYGHAIGEPRLLPLAALAALTLPLNAAACVPTALLVRKMRGRQLLVRPIAGKIAGLAALVTVAASDGQAAAVVAASVTTSAGGTAALWLAARRRPRWRWDGASAGALLRFGLFAGTDALFWMIGQRLFALAFAGAFGMRALGMLQLAVRLVEEVSRLLQSIVMRYALALFAEARRADVDPARTMPPATRVLNMPAVAVLAGLAAIGDLLVVQWFGRDWAAAGTYVRLLAAAGVLIFARMLIAPALKAIGRPDRVALAATLNLASALAVILALALVDARTAVLLWATREVLGLIIWVAMARRYLALRVADLARALAPSWVAGACMAAVLLGLRSVTEQPVVLGGIGALVYGGIWWIGERATIASWLTGWGGGRWRRSTS